MYGFINTASFDPLAQPGSFRDGLLKWFPSGSVSLTALTAKMMKSGKIDNPVHNWFIQDYPGQRGAILTPAAGQLGIFTNTALTVAYATGAVIGTVLHIGVNPIVGAEIRTGHTIQISDADHPANVGVILVSSVTHSVTPTVTRISGTVIRIDNGGAIYAPALTWSSCDRFSIIGNLNAEGAPRPSSIHYQPIPYSNQTQIWRTPLELSRTAERTKIRYASSAYNLLKLQTLELHAKEIEATAHKGEGWVGIADGNPIRAAIGLIPWIGAYTGLARGPSHIFDFLHDATVPAGTTFIAGGQDWLENGLAQVFSIGDSERFSFCGTGAAMGMNRLATMFGDIQISVSEKIFGLDISAWKMAGCQLGFKTHPLYNEDPSDPLYNALVVFNPKNVGFKYIDDTKFISAQAGSGTGIDGRLEEYLTEATFEWGIPGECAIFYNVGVDRP